MKSTQNFFAICLLTLFLRITFTYAQDRVNADFIYNEWALSIEESSVDILIFKDEGDLWFDNIPYNEDDNLKFTSYDNKFFLRYAEARKNVTRCGNDIPMTMKKSAVWEKGIWSLEVESDVLVLILERLKAEKGKKYVLTKRETFQVLNLEEDRMVLKKLDFAY